MYAHQVIETLSHSTFKDTMVLNKEYVMESIKSSIHFHLEYPIILAKKLSYNKTSSANDNFWIHRKPDTYMPPYAHTFIDTHHVKSEKGDSVQVSKMAALNITTTPNKQHLLYVFVCARHAPATMPWWYASPVVIEVAPDIENDSLDFYYRYLVDPDAEECNIDWWEQISFMGLIFARTLFTLLCCKNIGTKECIPTVKFNRIRAKKGKQPLFIYKTLVVKPTGKKQESIPKHLWENRIHLQRGHFKTYTEDKPLFGRLTGRYWWQPSVRGRNTDGVVMKDYLVHGKEAL